ncbi:nuclear transport factor 2 family protein [Kribbella sp. NPDC056951]|uniref:nuclear transport factor 2 family protein n=1 Tax=Kribbella sp. NPDC056951 TaxID=3345978 RepID=UPI00363DF119
MPEATTVFTAVDTQDFDAFAAMLADESTFVFGNQEPFVGIEAILAGNAAFFTAVQRTEHHINRVWTVGPTTLAETDVTYTRLDGKEVTLPALSTWDVDEAGLITSYQVFADLTPVFAP